jgi:HEAT repeat protein
VEFDQTGDVDEVPESFSRSVAAVWRAVAEHSAASGRSLAEALDTAVAVLAADERILALALTPLDAPAGSRRDEGNSEALFDAILGHLSLLARARRLLALLMRPAGSPHRADDPATRPDASTSNDNVDVGHDGLRVLVDHVHHAAPPPPRVGTASLTESLWGDWLTSESHQRFVASVAWALMGRIPLGLDSADVLIDAAQGTATEVRPGVANHSFGVHGLGGDGPASIGRPGSREDDGEPLVAYAVGRAALLGDPGARLLMREALVHRSTSALTRYLIVLGLGDGLCVPGLGRLTRLAGAALTDDATWARALLSAVGAVAGMTGSDPQRLLGTPAELVSAISLMPEVDDALAFLACLPEVTRQSLLVEMHRSFENCPPPVRAALAQALLAGRIQPAPGQGNKRLEAPAALLRERSPPVLSLVLGLLERVAEAVPQDMKTALGRAYSDHPDVGVRKALARAIPLRLSSPADRPKAPGDVVALPPQALARDDLDRLRVAIWSGENERIVELATCVPLDRRTGARESLLQALEIPNAPLRRALVEAIGRIGSHVDGPRLIEAAKRYRALEGTVAAALRELSAKAMAESLAEIYKRRLKWADDEAVDDYCAIAGPEQVMYLRDALETRFYPSARAGAARAIARKRAQEVVFSLRAAALSDTQEPSRLAALSALHELTGSSPSAGELAGHSLLFKSTEELEDAVERAKEAGSQALAGIRRTLARGSWKRRRAACEVLAAIPGDEAQSVLKTTLEDPDEDVRLAALEALVQRGWQPSNPRDRTLQALAARRIKELASEPDEVDTALLVSALGLGGHVFRMEVLEALSILDPALSYEEAALIAAARGDVAIAAEHPSGLGAVMRATDHTWQANPHRARFVRGLADVSAFRLVDALDGHHGDWSWRAREAQAQALFRFIPPASDLVDLAEATRRSVERLTDLVLEDDDDVRKAALSSLVLHGTVAAAQAIAAGLHSPFQEDRDVVARALGRMGPVALPVIERLMADTWWESRHGAALALSHWRVSTQVAVDHLVVLAVDAEYRVAQTARDGLAIHGLLPTTGAVVAAVEQAQTLTVEGLEPWLGLHRSPTAEPEVAHALDLLIEALPSDLLPQRLGLISVFRAEHLALWLEQVALGVVPDGDPAQPAGPASPIVTTAAGTAPAPVAPHHAPLVSVSALTPVPPHRHLGVRLAAADALRALTRRACTVCAGERTVRCPGCAGAGDVPCPDCAGKGTVMVRCPDPACTAHGTLRRIDSPRCPTCRGRGEVAVPCACEGSRGRTACALCVSSGRLVCAACEVSGEARFD